MISKSLYCLYKMCPRPLVWLNVHAPEKADDAPPFLQMRAEEGKQVGALAQTYFNNTFDCSCPIPKGGIDTKGQIAKTKAALSAGEEALLEASFSYQDLFCAVDILKKDEDGYSIYEVKSSKSVETKHLYDISFQKYVLELCGIKVKHLYLMHVNGNYVFHPPLDLHGFFEIECVDNDPTLLENLTKIESEVQDIRSILALPNEPVTVFNGNCSDCLFSSHCRRNLPPDRIDILNGVKTKAYDSYNQGIYTAKEYLQNGGTVSSKLGKIQAERILAGDTSTRIIKSGIKNFIDKVGKGPIYYLDFETTSNLIPCVDGFRPGEQYAYQYSLHIEYPDGQLKHEEYLGDSYDCTEKVAEHLVQDIPLNSCVMAYHASTEKQFIRHLAEKHPAFKDHLMNIHDHHFVDLLDVFKSGDFYDDKQEGQNSIKVTMPILCPAMEDAYHNLPRIHNGAEALKAFHTLMGLKEGSEEYDDLSKAMRAYCELDTLSMVEIYHALIELAKE